MIDLDDATYAAFYTAANMRAKKDPQGDSLHWPTLGAGPAERFEIDQLARFVRSNPGAPAEALWRYAHARALHAEPADDFELALDADRLPYEVFRVVLVAVDHAVDLAMARQRQREAIAKAAEPSAAVPFEAKGTLLERTGSMLEPADFVGKPMTQNKKAKGGKRGR